MLNFIREAGWGIYPVLAFGLAAILVALQQLRAPDPRRVATGGWLMALTGVAGLLGTATGMQASSRFLHQVAPDEKWIYVVGLEESLNNLVAASVLVMLAMIVMLAANLRATPKPIARDEATRSIGNDHAAMRA